ncbi:MAG: sn-glycerol-3-phosphate transporter permease U [Pseudomonadota bacterium]|jgi:sn-glycerol 3-phosphate transport system permease protein
MRRTVFPHRWLPWLLLAPQLAITLVFFHWPAAQALHDAFYRQDPWGLATQFVGWDNFRVLLEDPAWLHAAGVTAVFSLSVAVLALGAGLALAVLAERVVRGRGLYRTLLIWPYAVAPAVAGMLWLFLFSPALGTFGVLLRRWGVDWDPLLQGDQALALVVGAAAWKQVSYNLIFFAAGLQAVPKSLVEAAAIDGAGPARRFLTIVFPLLSPVSFFLLVVNTVYAFFDTFGVIHAVTGGGPAKATETLVYKVFHDGYVALDLGASSAQSVVLMVLVGVLTLLQFRHVERKVHYA